MTDPTHSTEHVDVVVVGAGVVGAAAARAAARRGRSVVLLDRFPLEEARGSSRGGARIIVPGPFPAPEYRDWLMHAFAEWQALETATGISFLDLRGVILTSRAMRDLVDDLTASGLDVEVISRAQVAERFGITDVDGDPVFLHKSAGMIQADRARAALLRSAGDLGVRMHGGEEVRALEPDGDGVTIETSVRSWRCAHAIVCAGPWTSDLLAPLGIELPLTVTTQPVAYFGTAADAARAPVLIEDGEGEPYSLPDVRRGLKVALHARGPIADPSAPWEIADPEAIERLTEWAHARFPWVRDKPSHVEACLYTNTPDGRHFVLHREGPLTVGSACNGQGFHIAPGTGEQLARLALDD